MIDVFLDLFLLFFIYSVLGWIVEVIDMFVIHKKLVNRGFLIGPYCPIYGFAAVIFILYLTQYKDNVITVFLLGTALCTIIEYLTSVLLEKLFNARWWDYKDYKFNLNGRICLVNCVLFGLLGVILIYAINPVVEKLIIAIPNNIILIITICCLIIFVVDTIFSCSIVKRLKDTFKNLKPIDNTPEIKEMVKDFLKTNHKWFQQRVMKAFPKLKFLKIQIKKK